MDKTKTEPRILVCGLEGAGKRMCITALVDATMDAVAKIETEAKPESETPKVFVDIVDIPSTIPPQGFATAMREQLRAADLVLWVIGYPKALNEAELAWMKAYQNAMPTLPLLVVGMGEGRAAQWNAATFSTTQPKTEEEQSVSDWRERLRTDLAIYSPADIVLCAIDRASDPMQRNDTLVALSTRIEGLLPKECRFAWITREKAVQDRGEKADKMIVAASTAAGAIGLIPLPIADMPFIITTQVALILGLCSLYGKTFTRHAAKSLVLTCLSALAGPIAFQNIMKVVPGLGSVVGGGVAFACTYAVGKATKIFLEQEKALDFSNFTKYVKNIFKEYIRSKKLKDKEIDEDKN
ncbi:MAG: DUF697 domain-containing protein [Desulfovibrio sp.]|nr:DUF697 domain-containing protein [Desulfovibrio sp.]